MLTVDVFDVAALERDYRYFAGLVASGATLWTMKKRGEDRTHHARFASGGVTAR